ncbi:MAG: ATP-binding protein, partial [Verrucomicrobiota bacterium]
GSSFPVPPSSICCSALISCSPIYSFSYGVLASLIFNERGFVFFQAAYGESVDEENQGNDKSPLMESQIELVKKAFAHHRELFTAVVDHLPVGVFCKDAEDGFRFIVWNRKNAEITATPASDAIGKTDYDLFPEETAAKYRADDERVMRENLELEIPTEDFLDDRQKHSVFHTRKVAIPGPSGAPRYLLGISEDITAQHVAEQELAMANEQLRSTQLQLIQMEKLESIGRLAAGVAHEVKNPLALILMGVEYLSGGELRSDDENIPIVVEEMRGAVRRADKIVRGLVDFSSDRQLNLESVSVNEALEHTLLMVRHELTKASIKVEKDLQEDLPPVKVDVTKFEQVLVNLIMNSIHAMQEVERAGVLHIRTSTGVAMESPQNKGSRMGAYLRKGAPVVFTEIGDNGTGIVQEHLSKAFDPFYTTKPTGIGTGLGLTVVKKIVELHQGQIDIRRNSDGGATVTLILGQAG